MYPHQELSIVFFSSSNFTIPILRDCLESQGKSLFNLVEAQMAGADTGNNAFIDQLILPDRKVLDDVIADQKTLLQSISIGRPLVVTQPDRELRGKILQNPISQFAISQGISVFQPQRIKQEVEEYQAFLGAFESTVGLVASFGQILPQALLDAHNYGIVNWHPSLLPLYRGPTPMQTTLKNGDSTTGLSWIDMDAGMDSGTILLQFERDLFPETTLVSLAQALGEQGSQTWAIALMMQILSRQHRVIRSLEQDHQAATFTKMLSKNDKLILPDTLSALEVINHFRAYQGFPGTVFESEYFGDFVRIDELGFVPTDCGNSEMPITKGGIVQDAHKRTLLVTKDECVHLKRITLLNSGKRIDLAGYVI